jgi:flagellar biogenesis protein FliO
MFKTFFKLAQPLLSEILPNLEAPLPQMTLPSYEGAFLKMFLTLIGLLLSLVAAMWALKRLTQSRLNSNGFNSSLKILERKPLSPKTMLYLVEMGNKRFMIAESQLEVRKLSEENFKEIKVD